MATQKLNNLVENGVDINDGARYESPLHSAAATGSLERVEYLLEHGADVNCKNDESMTALCVAILSGSLEMVQCLFEHGAKINHEGLDGDTPLHKAIETGSFEIVKYLVDQGANVNHENIYARPPLHRAVKFSSLDIVKYLVEHGANINHNENDRDTPLHRAVESGSLEIVKYLVEHGADVTHKIASVDTPLFKAVEYCAVEIVKFLVEHGADVNYIGINKDTPVYKAVESGSLEIVKCLVEHGADVHQENVYTGTLLHRAAESGKLEIVTYLIESGADVNNENIFAGTPLHRAVEFSSLEIVKCLFKNGAGVDHEDSDRHTPLHRAVKSGSLEIIEYLIEHGADVNHKNVYGVTPLQRAVESGSIKIVKYLIEHGGDVNHESIYEGTPLYRAVVLRSLKIVKCLIEHGADVNHKQTSVYSPLHEAVKSGSFEIVKYLIGLGADVNCKNHDEQTSLDCAAEMESLEMVEYLFENNATVTRENDKAWGEILFLACENGNIPVVESIFKHKVIKDINKCFNPDRSPLRTACYNGHTAVVESLLNNNVDIRKEKELECGNEEIISVLNRGFKTSVKHREKIQLLKQMEKEKLVQVEPPVKLLAFESSLLLGVGSMGTCVYVGVLQDDREVAVKRVLLQAGEQFGRNEKDILSSAQCPYIVSYLHFIIDDFFLYLILDLCEETLKNLVDSQTAEYLRDHGPRIIKEILSGLEFLHSHEIVHRDLKPSNVLVDVEGHMKLADFGISRVFKQDETTVSTDAIGTHGWMAAEVIDAMNRKVKCRFKKKSDIQVAGMIAFFVLTKGQHLFGNNNRMKNILKGNPVALKKLADVNARKFVSSLTSNKIQNRPFADETLRHSFLDQIETYHVLPRPRITLRNPPTISLYDLSKADHFS